MKLNNLADSRPSRPSDMSVMLEHLKPLSDLFPANNPAHIILRLSDC